AESGILVALGAEQCASPERGIEVPALALDETGAPDRCIRVSTCKTRKRRGTDGQIATGNCGTIQRLETECRAIGTGCKAKECVLTLSGVLIGIAAIRWRDNCLRARQKRKAGEGEQRERCVTDMRYCFHLFTFLSLRY